ncbi:hypothetical protein V8E36_007279 [Tilletia maclaganii]
MRQPSKKHARIRSRADEIRERKACTWSSFAAFRARRCRPMVPSNLMRDRTPRQPQLRPAPASQRTCLTATMLLIVPEDQFNFLRQSTVGPKPRHPLFQVKKTITFKTALHKRLGDAKDALASKILDHHRVHPEEVANAWYSCKLDKVFYLLNRTDSPLKDKYDIVTERGRKKMYRLKAIPRRSQHKTEIFDSAATIERINQLNVGPALALFGVQELLQIENRCPLPMSTYHGLQRTVKRLRLVRKLPYREWPCDALP